MEKFWAKVIKGPGCWAWTAYKDSCGYGRMCLPGHKTGRAHRMSWELHYGPIPDGLFVLHRCDNPECTNPEHLFLGTQRDNIADMDRKGRRTTRYAGGRRRDIPGTPEYLARLQYHREYSKKNKRWLRANIGM